MGLLSRLAIVGIVVGAAACTPSLPEVVRIQGFLVEGPSEPDNQLFVSGASIQILNRDATEELGTAVTDENGFFIVGGLEPATPVVLIAGKEETGDPHPFGVFTGFTENVDLSLFTGAVYTPQLAAALADIDEYSQAPGAPPELGTFTIDFDAPDNGGMVLGRIGVWRQAEFGLIFETVADAAITVTTGTTEHTVCYRQEPPTGQNAGAADCTLTTTSTDSRFGVFALPPGPVNISVTHPVFGTVGDDTILVEDGVTYLDFFALAFP